MRPNLYFVLTENCNLKCEHCYLSAGPGKLDTTISFGDFKKAVEHFPKISLDLLLTGGEIFTIKRKLYNFLDYLNFENTERKKNDYGKIRVCLQTNGSWATSEKRIEKILEKLKEFDVKKLDIPSGDIYHSEQGLDKKCLDRLYEQAKRTHYFENVEVRGTGFSIKEKECVFPIGRGAKINEKIERVEDNNCFCKKSLDEYALFINSKGKVSFCLRGIPMGNIFEEPLVEIVEKAKRNPILNSLNDGGVLNLAIQKGWDKEKARELIHAKGECGFCWSAFNFEVENQ